MNTAACMSERLAADRLRRPRRGVELLIGALGGARFVRAAAVLQLGSLGLTAVSFVGSVLLARALGSAGYGSYALVMSIGTTIGLLRRLGQDYAATTHLAEAHADGNLQVARDALRVYVFLSVVTSVVILPPAIVLAPWIGEHVFGDPDLGVPLQLYLVQGFWAVVPGWTVIALQATRRLGTLVRFENATMLLGTLLPVALALAGLGVLGVFWGQVVASLASLSLAALVYARLRRAEPLVPSERELAVAVFRPNAPLWRETRFSLSIAFDKNLVSLFTLVPILLLGLEAVESEVGQLRVALSYMAIPAVLLSPVSRLLMVDLPQLRVSSPERVRPFFLRVTLLGGLASIGLALPFALLAGVVLPLLYGPEFRAAPPLALALLLDAASLGIGIAAGPVFRTYGRTDLPILASVGILLFGLPATWGLIRLWGPLGAAVGYGGMMLTSRFVSYVQCLRIIPR